MHVSIHTAVAFAALAFLTGAALPHAHADHGGHDRAAGTTSPYSGLEARPIKALSPQQIDDLRAGRGMGLALPAELNGYPGPVHVLEQASGLELTGDQRSRMEEAVAAMKAETIPLGEGLIAAEAELDRLFRDRSVTTTSLNAATADVARIEGELRAAHLRYHLATIGVLSPDQNRRYRALRGYADAPARPGAAPARP